METHSQIILPNRRRFLKATVGGVVALQCYQPANAFLFVISNRIAIHGARMIAGLLFNAYRAVAVAAVRFVAEEAAVAALDYYFDKQLNEIIEYYPNLASIPLEKNFNHEDYKKAVIRVHPVRIGMSDEEYNAYRMQDEKIILSRSEDENRFELVAKYITDHKGRVLRPNENITRKITAHSQPAEYFLGDLIFPDGREKEHYQRMIELTEVTVFDQLKA